MVDFYGHYSPRAGPSNDTKRQDIQELSEFDKKTPANNGPMPVVLGEYDDKYTSWPRLRLAAIEGARHCCSCLLVAFRSKSRKV